VECGSPRAAGLQAGTQAFGDVAGDGVVTGCEAAVLTVAGDVRAGDLAAACGPGVGGLLFGVEICRDGRDCDGSPAKALAGSTVQPSWTGGGMATWPRRRTTPPESR